MNDGGGDDSLDRARNGGRQAVGRKIEDRRRNKTMLSTFHTEHRTQTMMDDG
jgi:hypothetical protein